MDGECNGQLQDANEGTVVCPPVHSLSSCTQSVLLYTVCPHFYSQILALTLPLIKFKQPLAKVLKSSVREWLRTANAILWQEDAAILSCDGNSHT